MLESSRGVNTFAVLHNKAIFFLQVKANEPFNDSNMSHDHFGKCASGNGAII